MFARRLIRNNSQVYCVRTHFNCFHLRIAITVMKSAELNGIIFYFLVFSLSVSWSKTGFPSQCILEDGKCIYHIQMTETCTPQITSERQPYQNDQISKMNEIEKSVDTMKKEHSKKISDLESTLFSLVHGNSDGSGHYAKTKGKAIEGNVDDFVEEYLNLISANQKLNLPGDPALRETHLLSMLHKEFSGIRHDLADTKWKLEEMEKMLQTTKRKLNRTTTILVQTTEKLMNTESSLRKSQDENSALKGEMKAKDEHLGKLQEQLKEVSIECCLSYHVEFLCKL